MPLWHSPSRGLSVSWLRLQTFSTLFKALRGSFDWWDFRSTGDLLVHGCLQSQERAASPVGARTRFCRAGTAAAPTSRHWCGAARSLCRLLNEVCCCLPGPGVFTHLGKVEAVARCLCAVSQRPQHRCRVGGWQGSLVLRGVTHSREPSLTGAGWESCASALPQRLAHLGSAPV